MISTAITIARRPIFAAAPSSSVFIPSAFGTNVGTEVGASVGVAVSLVLQLGPVQPSSQRQRTNPASGSAAQIPFCEHTVKAFSSTFSVWLAFVMHCTGHAKAL